MRPSLIEPLPAASEAELKLSVIARFGLGGA